MAARSHHACSRAICPSRISKTCNRPRPQSPIGVTKRATPNGATASSTSVTKTFAPKKPTIRSVSEPVFSQLWLVNGGATAIARADADQLQPRRVRRGGAVAPRALGVPRHVAQEHTRVGRAARTAPAAGAWSGSHGYGAARRPRGSPTAQAAGGPRAHARRRLDGDHEGRLRLEDDEALDVLRRAATVMLHAALAEGDGGSAAAPRARGRRTR